mmetsp:Transcript_12588/g.31398  ORF Transcript_12588/g.31398 Transcript_12588/m.31398 type:complete len:201 (-) Transcript_12588:1479-2081(-)
MILCVVWSPAPLLGNWGEAPLRASRCSKSSHRAIQQAECRSPMIAAQRSRHHCISATWSGGNGAHLTPQLPTVNVWNEATTGLTCSSSYAINKPPGFIGLESSYWYNTTLGPVPPRVARIFISMKAGSDFRPVSHPWTGVMSGRMMYTSRTNGSGTSRPNAWGSKASIASMRGAVMSSPPSVKTVVISSRAMSRAARLWK